MTPETFVHEFGVLAETPGGVAKLREMVLLLAVGGRLTKRHATDGSVAAMLAKRKQHANAHPENAATRPKGRTGGREATDVVEAGLVALSVGDVGMAAPEGWEWVSLVDVARLESGHTPSRNHPEYWDGGIPWIGIKDARAHHGGAISKTLQTVSELGLQNSAARLLPAGTVCLSRTASVGYVLVMGHSMATSQDFVNWVCGDLLWPQYLQLVLMAEKPSLLRFSKGAVHRTVYYPQVKAFQVLLPPLPEQKRIVAKVDQLMALCDELEARQTKRRKLSVRATAASLAALTDAQEPKVLRTSWKRVSGQFDALFDNVENVGQLRQAIFGLACSGHLTEQRTSADPLLLAVRRRRQTWMAGSDGNSEAARLRKKLEGHDPVLPESPPPAGWVWASLLTACWRVVDCHNKTAPYIAKGIPLVRTSNVRNGNIDLTSTNFVSKETYDYWSRRCPPEAGDVLFALVIHRPSERPLQRPDAVFGMSRGPGGCGHAVQGAVHSQVHRAAEAGGSPTLG